MEGTFTLNCRSKIPALSGPLTAFDLWPFHTFPQFFRIPPLPQTLSLPQLARHCVNPATSIRITNKLSLTSINYRATLSFDSSRPSSPPSRRPAATPAACFFFGLPGCCFVPTFNLQTLQPSNGLCTEAL